MVVVQTSPLLVGGHARFPMAGTQARQLSEWTVMDVDYRVDAVVVRARDWSAALDVAAELLGVPRERLVLVPKDAG